MVVEQFTQGAGPVYERLAEKGRMMPAGLEYVESWIDGSLTRCWQLMETEDPALRPVDGELERPDDLRDHARRRLERSGVSRSRGLTGTRFLRY